MNQLNTEKRGRIISCLVEGCSLRSTVRLTGFSRKGVDRVLTDVGAACAAYHNKSVRNLTCKVIQVDEVWSYTYCKHANIPTELKGVSGIGDTWTWVAIDADTKLIPAWHVGDRTEDSASLFIQDLKDRLTHRIQLTSDGHRPYIEAVKGAFGEEIDYARLVKLFGPSDLTRRYSPPKCTGTRRKVVSGEPDKSRISTSFVERQNLTIRMNNRRFTRLTNAFSKKIENHKHALAIHFMYYNFCRIHQTLRVTPAMEAGIAKHVWTTQELAALKIG